MEGGCDCGSVRYRLTDTPLIVHACHCRWCQRESASAFALNAMIEADRVTVLQGEPELIGVPSESGRGQVFARCPTCRIALWSNYAGAGPLLRFVRVGTLDTPDVLPPDVHIFTESKQPWMALPDGARIFPAYYRREETWSAEALARYADLLPAINAWKAQQ
ncbi:MAG: GFA family protein [Tabrizicola sp.]